MMDPFEDIQDSWPEEIVSVERVRAEDAMSLGPSTIRPSARREAVAKRMRDQELTRIVVTHSDGVLVGVLRREDLA
jgi:CBS domain-containing protein